MPNHPQQVPAVREDEAHLRAIRDFFTERRETYSVEEVAALWRVRPEDVLDIFSDELPNDALGSARFAWANVLGAGFAFGILRMFDVDRALGADFTLVLPATWKTTEVVIHVPQFIVTAIDAEPAIGDFAIDVRIEQLLHERFRSGNRYGKTLSEVPAR